MFLSQKTCIKIINQKQKTKHYKKTNIKSNHKIQKTALNHCSVPRDDDQRLPPQAPPHNAVAPLLALCLQLLQSRNRLASYQPTISYLAWCLPTLKKTPRALALNRVPVGVTNQTLRIWKFYIKL